jgi:putative endonuclease
MLYVLECQGGSLYTGISTDVERRLSAHKAGKGARYTRLHPPQNLLLTIEFPDQSSALQAEYAFKQLKPAAKRAFCAEHGTEPGQGGQTKARD